MSYFINIMFFKRDLNVGNCRCELFILTTRQLHNKEQFYATLRILIIGNDPKV